MSTLTLPKPKRKGRSKGQLKWTYETVLEPTGAASKYWDADAPAERATKRLAKDKLVALKAAEAEPKGSEICWTLSLYFLAIGHNHYCQIH